MLTTTPNLSDRPRCTAYANSIEMAGRVVTIAGATTIKEHEYQTDVLEVIFPASLLTIGKHAFWHCRGIKRIDACL